MNKETHAKMNYLKNKIENLPKENHVEIFKILQKNNVQYSENKNGIFINLIEVSPIIIHEVDQYVQYLETQNNEIKNFEIQKNKIEMLL
jgi:hypothetical protein